MAKECNTAVMPKLRFPEFRRSVGWKLVSLEDASVPVAERVGDKELTPISISAGVGFVPQTEKFGRDISGNQYRLYTLVRDGDFVYNKGNSLKFPQGCIYLLQNCGEVAAPNVFICFRLKDNFSNAFFQSCFENNLHGLQLKKHITSGARSNGLLNISKEHFFSVEIPVPRPAEQQKIADCLTSLDEVIASQGRKVEALKAHKRGLMQQLFPREGETRPRLRFPEFRKSDGWVTRSMADLLDRSSKPVSVDTEVHYREIGVRSHGKGVFHKEPISGEKIGSKRVFWVIADALVLNIVFAWEQAIATTSAIEEGMIASHRFPMYLGRPGKCDVTFLKYGLLTPQGKRVLGLASPGGAGRNRTLGQADFEKIEMMIPAKLAEQQKIADCLVVVDTQIAAEADQLAILKTHKQGLMQQLFPSPKGMTT